MTYKTILVGMALAVAGPAAAHVVLSQPHAPAGGYYTAYLRVGHGCEGAATTSIRLEVSPETPVVRPQPKPGWTLRIEHLPLTTPLRGEGGRMLSERVSAITRTGGPLPDAEWAEFGVSTKLPARTGALYFPVVQTCDRGEARWTETPVPGQPSRRLTHPAPMLTLDPPVEDTMGGMKMGG